MSLKAELEIWSSALAAYDAEKFEEALELFDRIADCSKIYANMGLIYATVGDHEAAVDHYEQLGLKFSLYSAEVLFNRGLCLIYMGRLDEGLADMEDARKAKVIQEHGVIDEAIQDKGQGYTVFSIPVGVLYRPSENKIKNAQQKDYMGKAKLVAASDADEAYTTFTGVTRLKQGITPQGAFVDDLQDTSDLGRSVTVPTPRVTVDPVTIPPLKRSITTINVPANARDRIKGLGPSPAIEPSGPVAADITFGAGPVRALTLKKQKSTNDIRREDIPEMPAPRLPEVESETRISEFYDNYIDSYQSLPPPIPSLPLPFKAPELGIVPNLARTNTNPSSYSPSRAPSRNAPPLPTQAPSLTRKQTRIQAVPSKSPISVYEPEEGYVSGDYEEVVPASYNLAKIRVKVHYQDDVRGMALPPGTSFLEFMNKLCIKFGATALDVKFKDEDGGKVSLKDDGDYEMAIETAKDSADGKAEGRLEVWSIDA